MQKPRTKLLAFFIVFLISACGPLPQAAPPAPPTLSELQGKWKSEHGFYIVFDSESATFSGSNDEQAAENRQGLLGTFTLTGDQLTLMEDADSPSCPGIVGQFEALLTNDGKLRLSIIEDPCIYRVEGLFQGGQGGHRLLEFRRAN